MATFASGSGFGVSYVKEDVFGVTPANPEMRRLRITIAVRLSGKV